MSHKAFTFIELIFVIVIIAIIGSFGAEFLANAYNGFLNTTLQSRLTANSEAAITQIAARLQYRIKDSMIVRSNVGGAFRSIQNANVNDRIIEWVGVDIEGWRGDWNGTQNTPNWSGFIDVSNAGANINNLISPQTINANITNTINALSNGTKTSNNTALFFLGPNSNVNAYGWGGAIADQNQTAHPVTPGNGVFAPRGGNFQFVDIYEFYQLAWTAYSVELNTTNKQLLLRYNYQPWDNTYNNQQTSILMEDVSSFTFQSVGDLIKIQVCVDDNVTGGNAVCKEKTIF